MIITLCGSARFERQFKEWNERLSLQGHTVFSLAVYPSDKGDKNWYTEKQKEILDRVHFQKIEASDAIFVIDGPGEDGEPYCGYSTRGEIAHALKLKKQVFLMSSQGVF